MGEGIPPCSRRGQRERRAGGRILLCAAALVGFTTPGHAAPPAGDGHDDQITAAEIHARLIANRFDSKILEATLLSQRDGRYQPIRIQVLWRRYPEGSEEAREGVLSRAVVRYLSPQDLRHTAYLVVDRSDGTDDQFAYHPRLRRVRRFNLPDLRLVGTDVDVADLLPPEAVHFAYQRLEDATVGSRACFRVEARPRKARLTHYSRLHFYVDKERFVPLRVRYWDLADREVKDLRAEPDSIRELDGRFFPIRTTIYRPGDGSATRFDIDLVVADPDIPDEYFTKRQLEGARKLRIPRETGVMIRRY